MNYTLRDPNGNVLLAVESSPVVTEADMKADLDKVAKACESAFDEVTKYQDAMAVMSSEGFGEHVKAVASKAWEKIKEFFINIGKWIKHIFDIIKQKIVTIGNKINRKSITTALQTIKNKYDARKKTTTESETTDIDKKSIANAVMRFDAVCKCFDNDSVNPDDILRKIIEIKHCDEFGKLSRSLVDLNDYANDIKTSANKALDYEIAGLDKFNSDDLDTMIEACISDVKKYGIESIVDNCNEYIARLNKAVEELAELSNMMVELSNAELVQQKQSDLVDSNYVVDTEAIKLANLKCKTTNMCRSCVNDLINVYSKLVTYANRVLDISAKY